MAICSLFPSSLQLHVASVRVGLIALYLPVVSTQRMLFRCCILTHSLFLSFSMLFHFYFYFIV
ncbi:hypothetical protein J3E68DRAFT_418879 [Trichoderma sp. SZMC 28012]